MAAERYVKALQEFDKLSKDIRKLGKNIEEVGLALRESIQNFSFEHNNTALPGVLHVENRNIVDANFWPSAKVIIDLIEKWHLSRAELEVLWNDIPPEQRRDLPAPPPPQ